MESYLVMCLKKRKKGGRGVVGGKVDVVKFGYVQWETEPLNSRGNEGFDAEEFG